MRVAGIIAEYNPFHNGHAHQIRQVRALGFDAVVCVMSPGVVQRGSLALMPVQVRAFMAFRYVRQAVCGFQGEDLEDVHAMRFRQVARGCSGNASKPGGCGGRAGPKRRNPRRRGLLEMVAMGGLEPPTPSL